DKTDVSDIYLVNGTIDEESDNGEDIDENRIDD
ncbi:MAG: hypothetical protein Satyrvirus20_1, partial [Satyrvirus sp.]